MIRHPRTPARALLLGGLLLAGSATTAQAFEGITMSGYLTVKATYGANDDTSGNQADYGRGYATDSVNFNTYESRVGMQFDASLTEHIDTTLILLATGGNDNFNIGVEWAYVDYNFDDRNRLRIGRYKGPFYMISEYQEVGYAYPWVTAPLEVYSTNPIRSVNGLAYVFQTTTASGMDFLLEIYGGNGSNESVVQPNVADYFNNDSNPNNNIPKGTIVEFDTKNMIGFNTTFGTEAVKFRVGYMSTKVDAPAFGMNNVSGSFGGLGLIVDLDRFLGYVEVIDRDTDDSAQMQSAFPDQRAGYATLGYRFGDYLPYLTVAKLDRGKTDSAMALRQTSLTLGLRYEIADGAALKFEATRARPEENGGAKYGLFDAPLQGETGTIVAASFDLIF